MKPDIPVKLFADAHVFDQEYQGTRTFIKELYAILAKKNDLEIYLGAYDIDNLKKNFFYTPNITFVKYKSRSAFIRLFFEIPSIVTKYGIDYAHFQYIIPPIKKCKYVNSIHDVIFNEYPEGFSFPYRLLKRISYRTSAARADIVTTVSEYSKKSIQKYLTTGSKDIHVISNGVASKFFEAYDKGYSKRIIAEKYGIAKFILFVSRFEERKNQAGLLRAFLKLKLYEEGFHLVLLGHRSLAVPDFDYIMNALPNPIKKFIFISSKVDDEDLIEFYRAAEAFVYPSKAEGFAIPPLEAAALKVPVICSNTSAMSDYSFFMQYHIDPFNPKLLEDKLNEILRQPLHEDSLRRISDIIRQQYDWHQSANKFYQLLLGYKTTP